VDAVFNYSCCVHAHAHPQLQSAEQLREEVRLEREKLGSKEARLAGLEAALEATRREMDRQAAEVAAAMQVGGQGLGAELSALWLDRLEEFSCLRFLRNVLAIAWPAPIMVAAS
jgi:hypothetical protein